MCTSCFNNQLFCIYGFRTNVDEKREYFLKNIKQMIFVMAKYCVFFAVRSELSDII
jgi:hypothetical protein